MEFLFLKGNKNQKARYLIKVRYQLFLSSALGLRVEGTYKLLQITTRTQILRGLANSLRPRGKEGEIYY